ncbi:hypothetical protein EGW08_004026 [Elysia chlorotica]|uniref:T-box domain-containing protein n=1 Tax=Elysia chlorotica TaxID=188477 RepID=A0A433U2Z3_ELYCH|nr:hypothetical protein EGW08_004026 [Elysia chlorotica]
METSKKIQEGRHSIQNILREDKCLDYHGVKVVSTSHISNKSSSPPGLQDTSITPNIHRNPNSVGTLDDSYKSGENSLAKGFNDEKKEGSVTSESNTNTPGLREAARDRTKELCTPIWLLNSWTTSAAPALESETINNSHQRSFDSGNTNDYESSVGFGNIISKQNLSKSIMDGASTQDHPTMADSFTDRASPDLGASEASNHELIHSGRQDPNPQRYRVDERLTNNVCQTKDGVSVTLLNSALWKAFSTVGTEMIINRSGRRMFPYLALSVSGLSPHAMYRVSLQILPASSRRYKYITNRWLPVGIADTEAVQDPYIHTDSLSSGEQLNKIKLIFSKVKLTNNKESADCNILLHSMHKYRIVTTFTQIDSGKSPDNQHTGLRNPSLSFHFPETDFIAVTAYQNEAVTQMKIHNNPFAKAFRDANFSAFRRGVSGRRKRQSLYLNNMKPTKRSRFSQRSRGETSDIASGQAPRGDDDTCQLPLSVDAVRMRPHTKFDHGFLLPETSLDTGAGMNSENWTRPIERASEMQASSQASSFSLTPDKLGLAAVSPWVSLYSNLVRSHLLQFQYLHADTLTAATPDLSITSTAAANTPSACTNSKSNTSIRAADVATNAYSWRPEDIADRSCLEVIPRSFQALCPSETTGNWVNAKPQTPPQPIPAHPDNIRCMDSQHLAVKPPKSVSID